MNTFLQTYELPIRVGSFVLVFAAMAAWEVVAPFRTLQRSKAARWANNFALMVINTILVRGVFPLAAIGVAGFVAERGMGALNIFEVPHLLAVALAIAALDLAIYLQHLMFHAVPLLWRLHRVHHADVDFDVTTGLRFHPIEAILSMLIKFAVILVVGPPVVAVLAFEILLNITAMFNHGNVHMSRALDRVVRWLVVTPDMHRIHHSIDPTETNTNFGFNLPWWDRLFGTYLEQPRVDHEAMQIGLEVFRSPGEVRIDRMLLQPFRSDRGENSVERRHSAVE